LRSEERLLCAPDKKQSDLECFPLYDINFYLYVDNVSCISTLECLSEYVFSRGLGKNKEKQQLKTKQKKQKFTIGCVTNNSLAKYL